LSYKLAPLVLELLILQEPHFGEGIDNYEGLSILLVVSLVVDLMLWLDVITKLHTKSFAPYTAGDESLLRVAQKLLRPIDAAAIDKK